MTGLKLYDLQQSALQSSFRWSRTSYFPLKKIKNHLLIEHRLKPAVVDEVCEYQCYGGNLQCTQTEHKSTVVHSVFLCGCFGFQTVKSQ